jgi:hypothetical protein
VERNDHQYEGPSMEARLNNLGLKPRWLINAVQASEIERRSCSVLEPSNAPGFKAWVAAFRTLAEQLVGSKWAKIETRGLPRLVNKDSAVAIAVCNGDDGVGVRDRDPKSKNPRGEQSALLIRSNQRQLNLFSDPEFAPVPPDEEQVTWWLLIYSDELGALRAELSLPVGIGDDDRFSIWKERILLDIPRTDDSLRFHDHEELPPEIEVSVRPKR